VPQFLDSERFRSAPFRWTAKRERAAALLARDEDTDQAIARACATTDRALRYWKSHPEFAARVREQAAQLRAALIAEGIVTKQHRIDQYNRDWQDLERVKQARASHYADAVPGGDTGLIVGKPVQVRVVRDAAEGPRYSEVMEYKLDTGLIDARMKLAKQAAQELGQWVEKQDTRQRLDDSFTEALRELGRSWAEAERTARTEPRGERQG
jgi:hypothetical protein